MIAEIISGLFILTGSLFFLAAGVGVLRFRDLPGRIHASTKAPSMAIALILTGIAIVVSETDIILKAVLIIAFIYITAPIASHMIGKSGYSKKNKE